MSKKAARLRSNNKVKPKGAVANIGFEDKLWSISYELRGTSNPRGQQTWNRPYIFHVDLSLLAKVA